jgi:hypothetical protein
MGTRPGALDPGVVLYLFQELGMSRRRSRQLLYKKSGLLGISGISNDMRVLLDSTDASARLAVEYFVYRAAKEIGRWPPALRASMHWSSPPASARTPPRSASGSARPRPGSGSSWTRWRMRSTVRASHAREPGVGWVIRTNEELMIARHTGVLLGLEEPRRDGADMRSNPMAVTTSQRQRRNAEVAPGKGSGGLWQNEINVRDFIQQNYEPYDGDESFLAAGDRARRRASGTQLQELFVEERRKGVLDVSQIPELDHRARAGYIDRDNEIIVGLQTDAPLKRAIMPNGGLRMVVNALKSLRLRA